MNNKDVDTAANLLAINNAGYSNKDSPNYDIHLNEYGFVKCIKFRSWQCINF